MAQTSPVRLGLLGADIGRSLSPVLHEAALRAAHIDGAYELIDASTEPAAARALDAVRSGALRGLNVTTPWKRWAAERCDVRHTPGPVNTLWLEHGRLHGASTDGPGFVDAVHRLDALDVRGCDALLLGAGGAAVSIARSLVAPAGVGVRRLLVYNRTPVRAAALVAQLQPDARGRVGGVPVAVIDDLEQSVAGPDALGVGGPQDHALVVHATALGHGESFSPSDALEDDEPTAGFPWLPWRSLDSVVLDVVYARRLTRVERRALDAGFEVHGGRCPRVELGFGREMLLHQAARSFARWFGRAPDREAMRHALAAALV